MSMGTTTTCVITASAGIAVPAHPSRSDYPRLPSAILKEN